MAHSQINEADVPRKRIEGMDRDSTTFKRRAGDLVGVLAPERRGAPRDRAAEQPYAQSVNADRIGPELEELDKEIKQLEQERSALDQAIDREKAERKRMEGGMSDGTADPLYLALRLTGLEQYLENNEPLPFVVDDIRLRFDDERSLATLKGLCDLSRKTQVIFFIHHRHRVELIEQRSPDSAIMYDRLGPDF